MKLMILPVILFSYLIGSIPTGYWLGLAWKGIDVRQHGSGNLGATNIFRVLGKAPGTITLVFDILKGALPVLWTLHHFPGNTAAALATGLAAITGHTASVFIGFKGGKGVATSAGVFLALLPGPCAAALIVFFLCLSVTRIVSISSILASITLPAASFILAEPKPLSYTATVVACLLVWKHRTNMRRLISGTENRVGKRGSP
jgi:glycerol-3-phosphate acyltransferase PlsY